jgi:CheY-like chemotaxis protein
MKILVADDSPVLRAAVTKLLEPAGYHVVAAEDGVEAITKFYEEDPDLVLLDIQMPKLNGYVVCRLIKEDPAAANVPVMILTVRDSAEDRYWGVKSGADGYLTKDRLGDDVVQAINSALASRALRELSRDQSSAPPMKHETDVLTRVCEMLDRKLFEATVVNEITAVATRPVGVHATAQEILTSVGRLIECDAAGLVMAEEGRLELHTARVLDVEDAAGFQDLCDHHLHDLAGGADLPAELSVEVVTLDDSQDAAPAKGWHTFHSVPLRSRGQLIGLLALGSHDPGAYGEAVHRTLRTITPSIVSVLESARNFQRNLESEARATFSQLG